MSSCCAGAPHDPAAFACHRCGACCTNLRTQWRNEAARFAALPQDGIYRLATAGGLRMFAWETTPFPRERLRPLLVLADGARERLIGLVYELDADRCPRYDDVRGCTVYDERPTVCRAFPLLVLDTASGPQVAASALCPARVPVVVASQVAARPEPVIAAAYPHEAPAALAVPALLRHLADVVRYLAKEGVVRPATGLDAATVDAWRRKDVLDLVTVLEEAGVMTRQDLQERTRSTLERLASRWVAQHPVTGR